MNQLQRLLDKIEQLERQVETQAEIITRLNRVVEAKKRTIKALERQNGQG